jgi:hypothetical protein
MSAANRLAMTKLETTRSKTTVAALLAAFATTTLATNSFAQEMSVKDAPSGTATASSSTDSRLFGQAESSFQLNPMLVRVGAGASYRYVMSRDEQGMERTHLQAGAALVATTSYVSPQVHAEIRPLRVLRLRAEYGFVAYTSRARGLVSFGSKDDDFGSSSLDRANPESGSTHRASISHRFEDRFGPVLLRGGSMATYLHTSGGDGATAFYMPDTDTLVKSNDVLFTSRTDVFFTLWRGGPETDLLLGPSLQSTWAVRTGLMRQRVGGAIAFRSASDVAFFGKPTIGLDVGINADDPNRQGEAYGQLALSTQF